MTHRNVATAALLAALALPAASARAQSPLLPGPQDVALLAVDPPEGTGNGDPVLTLYAHDFNLMPGLGTEGPGNIGTTARICATGPCVWLAGIHLPTGASLRSVELSACDGDAAREARIAVFSESKLSGPLTALAPFAGTGAAPVPGCATFVATLTTPVTIDNSQNVYILDVVGEASSSVNWTQARVRYRLQVSPPPAVATFPNDVPTTHPFFRFVEALASAGITGGCGGGSYCPDQPVTRGQMAVFLSTALGLHFPDAPALR